jgi:Eukaryotic aspartyl protease
MRFPVFPHTPVSLSFWFSKDISPRLPTASTSTVIVSCLSRFFVYRSQAHDFVAHATGEVIFGGIDSSKYTGDLISLPIVPSPDGNARLTVQWTSLNIYTGGEYVYQSSQSSSSLNNGPATLLDSGTTLAEIPQDVIESMSSIFSLTYDSQAGLWLGLCSITTENVQLEFGFGAGPDVTITVAASEIMRPIPGDNTYCLFGFQNGGTDAPFTLGDTFLTSTYAYYDFDAYTISLAQANWT